MQGKSARIFGMRDIFLASALISPEVPLRAASPRLLVRTWHRDRLAVQRGQQMGSTPIDPGIFASQVAPPPRDLKVVCDGAVSHERDGGKAV